MNDIHGRILCVEDDADTFELISAILDEHEVAGASTCEKAAGLIAKESFRLIILDYLLPDGNGLELCNEIRRIYPQTPIIFVTGSSDLNERQAVEAGAAGVIYKTHQDFLDRLLTFADHGMLPEPLISHPELL